MKKKSKKLIIIYCLHSGYHVLRIHDHSLNDHNFDGLSQNLCPEDQTFQENYDRFGHLGHFFHYEVEEGLFLSRMFAPSVHQHAMAHDVRGLLLCSGEQVQHLDQLYARCRLVAQVMAPEY